MTAHLWLGLVLGLVGTGLAAGLVFGSQGVAARERELGATEAKLHTEWEAVRTAERLNAAYARASRAMVEEAVRASQEQLLKARYPWLD